MVLNPFKESVEIFDIDGFNPVKGATIKNCPYIIINNESN
jgi:hypothetical protein